VEVSKKKSFGLVMQGQGNEDKNCPIRRILKEKSENRQKHEAPEKLSASPFLWTKKILQGGRGGDGGRRRGKTPPSTSSSIIG